MGARYNINNGNGNGKNKTITEPASQIHEVVSTMADHGEAWKKSHDRRSIWYIDANKLYGYAMMQKLPYKDFKYYRCYTKYSR